MPVSSGTGVSGKPGVSNTFGGIGVSGNPGVSLDFFPGTQQTYVAEDGSSVYITEDGVNEYVTEG